MFDELNRVGPRIQKMDTRYRKALQPGLKLAVTLRHLAAGAKYSTLQYDFRMARNTICNFIYLQCARQLWMSCSGFIVCSFCIMYFYLNK